ncbi:MAG: hypothetical protein SynsKO_19010 [Synoicihabitans sp.]
MPSFAELAQKADRVIHGKVLSQRSFWDSHEGQRFIRTEVEFEVYDRSGARNVVDHVTLRFMGGRVDEMIMNVAGMPTFTLGEEVVLFERGNGHTICPLVGWRHGHYRISRRGDGSRPIVRRADFSLLRETAEVSRPFGQKQAQMNALSRGEEALSLGDFLAEVTALRTKGGARE